MKDKINIVIADDHEITRSGIKLLLSYQHNFEVIGEAGTGREAYKLISELKPDIALLDIDMPEWDGIFCALKTKNNFPETKTILLTALNEEHLIQRALLAGADGYLLKKITQIEIIESILKILTGKKVFSQSVLQFIETNKFSPSLKTSKPIEFTKREQQILELISKGMDNNTIADNLGIAVNTIHHYCTKLRKKTGSKTRTGLVKFAIINGD